MTPYDEITEIREHLQQSAAKSGLAVTFEPLSIWNDLAEAEQQAKVDSVLLQPWLAISELAIDVLRSLHDLALESNSCAQLPPSYALLVGRACNAAVGIRHLVTRGLDEVANVVLRSFLENVDIAIVAQGDPSFAERFITRDSKKFYWNEIARGAVQEKVEKVLRAAGVNDPDRLQRRKDDSETLSRSTHSAFSSAFHGSAVIALADQRMITSPLGHVGIGGPVILGKMAVETKIFAEVTMRLSATENPPPGLARNRVNDQMLLRIGGSFFPLQSMLERHWQTLTQHIQHLQPVS